MSYLFSDVVAQIDKIIKVKPFKGRQKSNSVQREIQKDLLLKLAQYGLAKDKDFSLRRTIILKSIIKGALCLGQVSILNG